MVQLYEDQEDLVARVRQAMRGSKRVLMQACTGAGKTQMTANMMAGTKAKGTSSMMVVPRKELLRQTIMTVESYDMPFGVISPDHRPQPFARCQIAMGPTLARRLDRVAAPNVLFIDECHYGGAELDRIIKWARAAGSWIVGMSATPMKTNGQPMGEWYDVMVEGLPMGDLIQLGRLSEYRYFAPSAPDLSGVATRDGEFVKSQLDAAMEQDSVLIGNAVSTYKDHAPGRLNTVFCTSRKHAGLVAQAFREGGVPSATIDGTMSDEQRGEIIRAFARREILALCNVDLLTFGFDLSAAADMDVTVECMSDLRPTKSLPLQLQKWGRVLRRKPFPAIILDHAGNAARHGLPDDPREWSLDGKKKRASGGERSEPVRQCEIAGGGCGFVHRPSPACPNCGRVYPVASRMIEEREGTLAEIKRGEVVQRKKEQGRADTLEDLIAVGRARGMANPAGWARHVIAGREAKRRA